MPAWWFFAAYLLLPYALVNLIWRGLRYPAYWRRWPERFGFVAPINDARVIWVHAVSVGEVRSSAPLVKAIAERLPHHQILVTTMTPTGSDQVRELFGGRVLHSYVPYDFPDAVNRFLDRVKPEIAVIAETEFWPNLFGACARRRIPLNLVNVRLSQASFRGYSWVGATVETMLSSANLICAQSSLDAQRLRNLGVEDRLIKVAGNLKFDVEVPASIVSEGLELRERWGRERPVLIAGSTHSGEERQLLEALSILQRRYPDLLLVLVPRHPERFAAVARISRRRGFDTALRSEVAGVLPPTVEVLLGDTMGELQRLYAAADVAFIGGSLVRHGGQNPLEACAVRVPVIFGPHMFHFEEISAMALERGAARQVRNVGELAAAMTLYIDQPSLRAAAGEQAHTLISDNHGALENTLTLLSERSFRALDLAADAKHRRRDNRALH